MTLFGWLHARCREEETRAERREQALREEIRNLTDKVVALADKRALQVVNREEPPKRTQEEKDEHRPSLRIPTYVNRLSSNGHVNLASIRQRLEARSRNGGKPPVAE